MWKVLLADDEPFVREGLRELIAWEELGYSLEGCYKNGTHRLAGLRAATILNLPKKAIFVRY